MDSTIMTGRCMIDIEHQIVSREILTCGINTSDKIVHFGSGYKDSMLYRYLVSLKDQNLIGQITLDYTMVDPDGSLSETVTEIDSNGNLGAKVNIVESSMQEFLDGNTENFDWSIITGIFDSSLYGDKQFQFVDKILDACFNTSNHGCIFTFDVSKESNENYTINHIISYVNQKFNRYRINKVNEKFYVVCIYRHYYSSIQ